MALWSRYRQSISFRSLFQSKCSKVADKDAAYSQKCRILFPHLGFFKLFCRHLLRFILLDIHTLHLRDLLKNKTRMADASAAWECGSCAGDFTESGYRIARNPPPGTKICATCLAEEIPKRFELALKYEYEYPAKWDNANHLDVNDFRSLLGEKFVSDYLNKAVEYETPKDIHVYCPCEHFLGRGPAPPGKMIRCPNCRKNI